MSALQMHQAGSLTLWSGCLVASGLLCKSRQRWNFRCPNGIHPSIGLYWMQPDKQLTSKNYSPVVVIVDQQLTLYGVRLVFTLWFYMINRKNYYDNTFNIFKLLWHNLASCFNNLFVLWSAAVDLICCYFKFTNLCLQTIWINVYMCIPFYIHILLNKCMVLYIVWIILILIRPSNLMWNRAKLFHL